MVMCGEAPAPMLKGIIKQLRTTLIGTTIQPKIITTPIPAAKEAGQRTTRLQHIIMARATQYKAAAKAGSIIKTVRGIRFMFLNSSGLFIAGITIFWKVQSGWN